MSAGSKHQLTQLLIDEINADDEARDTARGIAVRSLPASRREEQLRKWICGMVDDDTLSPVIIGFVRGAAGQIDWREVVRFFEFS
jgi:hypothetical protein